MSDPTITLRTREDCLLYAQALLEQVVEQLDVSQPTCGVYQNRHEIQAAQILSAMAMQLHMMAGQAWAALARETEVVP